MKETILNAEKNGIKNTIKEINEQKFILEQLQHLLSVLEFCSLLEKIIYNLLIDKSHIFLKFEIKKKKQKINQTSQIIHYLDFNFLDKDNNNISDEIEEKYPNLFSFINEYILNFHNLNIYFTHQNFQKKYICFPLTYSGIENIRQNLLSKDMFISYQYTKLQKILNNNNNNNEEVIKI